MSNKHKDKILTVDIERFTKKGNGLGMFDPWKVEVPFTMKGDVVQARLLRKRRGVFKAVLESLENPAKERIEAKCRHFGECGGCRWQHVPYDLQLREKEARIKEYFQGLSDIISPIIPCHSPWTYRNKMEFSFSSDLSGNRYLGLMMEGGRGKVLNLTECHLCQPWMIEVLTVVKGWWENSQLEAYHPFKDTGSLRNLTLREGSRTGDKMVILTVSGNPDFSLNQMQLKCFVEAVGSSFSIFLRIHQIAKGRPTQFYEMRLSGPDQIREEMTIFGKTMSFSISPKAFFQPNTVQAEKLYQKALEMAEIKGNDVVYDLYCGTGTLGLCAAQKALTVVGIELLPEAILDARKNAKLNQCENIQFFQGDVCEVLKKLSFDGDIPLPDVVLVDPPRAGLDSKALTHLQNLQPKTIVYVSCNPATQAENVQELIKFGYRVKGIQPVDQFSQTVHIENIVVLRKGAE